MSEFAPPNPEKQIYKAADLISYRDAWQFSDEMLQAENERVHKATSIEREWCKDLDLYKTDADILGAAESGQLALVKPTVGILPIQRLIDYTPERANPAHKFHYSPPYLQPGALKVAEFVGRSWATLQREEKDEPFLFLPLTSAARSLQYQESLTERTERTIAIDAAGDYDSSHEFGWAFDIDGTGLYRYDSVQRHVQAINPREPNFDDEAELVATSRADLRGVLQYLQERNLINFVEEVPGTKEWCFHVCVNPHKTFEI